MNARLVVDLMSCKPNEAQREVLRRAMKGWYHDATSPLPFPQRALIADLIAAGLKDFALRAERGDYASVDMPLEQLA